jgi:MFS family permease
VLGGVGGAVYTLLVIELGHRLGGSGLVRAMALLITAYTAGSTVGPAIGGWLFDQTGLAGLAGTLLAIGAAAALLAARAVRAPPVLGTTTPARGASRR